MSMDPVAMQSVFMSTTFTQPYTPHERRSLYRIWATKGKGVSVSRHVQRPIKVRSKDPPSLAQFGTWLSTLHALRVSGRWAWPPR